MNANVQRGDRVRLVATSDPYTLLRPGAQGTVFGVREDARGQHILMRWDDGSSLTMLPEEGDIIAKLEEECGRLIVDVSDGSRWTCLEPAGAHEHYTTHGAVNLALRVRAI